MKLNHLGNKQLFVKSGTGLEPLFIWNKWLKMDFGVQNIPFSPIFKAQYV